MLKSECGGWGDSPATKTFQPWQPKCDFVHLFVLLWNCRSPNILSASKLLSGMNTAFTPQLYSFLFSFFFSPRFWMRSGYILQLIRSWSFHDNSTESFPKLNNPPFSSGEGKPPLSSISIMLLSCSSDTSAKNSICYQHLTWNFHNVYHGT